MSYNRQVPRLRLIFNALLLVVLSSHALLFSREAPKGFPYSSREFQDHLRLSFSEIRAKNGPSRWSMLIQKKALKKLHVVVLNCGANSKVSAYYRAYESGEDGSLALDGVDQGQDGAARLIRWKALDVSNRKLSRLITELGKARVSVLSPAAELLDGDYYCLEAVKPPISLSVKFNSIDPHDVPLARLLDELFVIVAD